MDSAIFSFDMPQIGPWGGPVQVESEWGWALALVVTTMMVGGPLSCALKGKYGALLLFFLLPGLGVLIAVICGFRLAKPRSFWAKHMYDRKTMAAAIDRHEPPINLDEFPEPKVKKGYERPVGDHPVT